METANTELANAQAQKDTDQTNYDSAVAQRDNAQQIYERALSKQSSLEQALDSAKTAQAQAQAAYDYVTTGEQGEAYEEAAAELETAKQNLANATAQVTNAQTAYDSSISEVAQAQSALNTAQANLDACNSDQSSLDAAIVSAQNKVNEAQSELDSKQSTLDAAQVKYDEIFNECEYYKTKENYENLVKEMNECQAEYDTAKAAYDAAQTKLSDAQAEIATEDLTQYNKGSLGFFEWLQEEKGIDTTYAIGVLKGDTDLVYKSGSGLADKTTTHEGYNVMDYTNLGAEGDATSLESIRLSIQFLKVYNEIRAKEGLDEVYVSPVLMAEAQIDANYSSNVWNHSYVFESAENIVSNCAGIYTSGVEDTAYYKYGQWYTAEKDNVAAGTGQTGHYYNIVSKRYTVTGLAVSTSGKNSAAAQTFDAPHSNGKTLIGAMSLSDFEKIFNEYYELTSSGKLAYWKALEEVEKTEYTYSSKAAALNCAQRRVEYSQDGYDNMIYSMSKYQTAIDAAQAEVNQAQSKVDSAKYEVKVAQAKADENKAKASELENVKNEKQSALTTATNAQTKKSNELKIAQANEEAKKNAVAEKQSAVDAFQNTFCNKP